MKFIQSLKFSFIIFFLANFSQAKTLSLVAVSGYDKVAAYKEVITFVSAVIKDAGYGVKVVEAPRLRGALTVNSGEYDALPIRGLEDADLLPNVIVSSFPVAFTIFRVVSLSDNKKFSESKLKDFSGAAVLNNTSIQKEMKKRGLHPLEVNVSYAELMQILLSHRVDYVVMPEEFVASLMDQDVSVIKKINVSSQTFVRTPLYFSMNKKHRDIMPEIEKSFRKALPAENKEYKYIRNSMNRKLEKE